MTTAQGWTDRLVGNLDDKKQFRAHRARVRRLPDDYRAAARALETYLTRRGPASDAAALLALLTDLVERLEAGVERGVPVADVVGQDPAAFADDLLGAHPGGGWVDGWAAGERARLADAVRAAGGAR